MLEYSEKEMASYLDSVNEKDYIDFERGKYLMNNDNVLALRFETDEMARESEILLKQKNLKTKHNTCEITVLNISDYNVTFN